MKLSLQLSFWILVKHKSRVKCYGTHIVKITSVLLSMGGHVNASQLQSTKKACNHSKRDSQFSDNFFIIEFPYFLILSHYKAIIKAKTVTEHIFTRSQGLHLNFPMTYFYSVFITETS